MVSLVEHGRITTTVDKAKELRRHIEPIVTIGKTNDLATRRLLLSRIPNQNTVNSILTDLGPRFKDRNGGYTRIIKIGRRPGDTAEMAFIEFVDHDWEKASKKTDEKSEAPAKKAKADKAAAPKKKATAVKAKKSEARA